ncbi:MAG: peptide chain release factor N(5)-glutamine methyltransferase [Gammaproteobacteria bacterium]|nr:peptide chain release factor N(5)-glutamine methyltransferase [Gammaproteobacteria bacterium]
MPPKAVADALELARGLGLDRFDAELLLTECSGMTRSQLIARPDTPLTADAACRYLTWIERRASGEPVAYITGRKGFMDFELEVTPAVLIPRPETELLVTTALELMARPDAHVVDLGTGSGAIALALAVARPDWRILATDISAPALAVAARNAERIAPGRVEWRRSDWFEDLGALTFDLIIANPPYIAVGDPDLARDVARHEPALALFAADKGQEALAELAEAAPRRLHAGGWILLEHGHRQGPCVRSLLAAAGLQAIRTLDDFANLPRVTIARRPA